VAERREPCRGVVSAQACGPASCSSNHRAAGLWRLRARAPPGAGPAQEPAPRARSSGCPGAVRADPSQESRRGCLALSRRNVAFPAADYHDVSRLRGGGRWKYALKSPRRETCTDRAGGRHSTARSRPVLVRHGLCGSAAVVCRARPRAPSRHGNHPPGRLPGSVGRFSSPPGTPSTVGTIFGRFRVRVEPGPCGSGRAAAAAQSGPAGPLRQASGRPT
jgi:hypothetical protein